MIAFAVGDIDAAVARRPIPDLQMRLCDTAARYGRFRTSEEPRDGMSVSVMELGVVLLSLGVLVAAIAAGVFVGINLSKRRRRDGDARPPRAG